MALIEIDGLLFSKMGGSFHGELFKNQMVINKGLPSGNLGHLPNMRVYHPSGGRMWRWKIHEHNPDFPLPCLITDVICYSQQTPG